MDAPFPDQMLPAIEKFLQNDGDRHPGQDLYPEVFDSPYFMPLQRKNELAEMMRRARSYRPQVVMEIGADKGGGLYHWCMSQTTVEYVVACEIRGCPYKHLFEKNFPWIDFLWLESSSYEHQTAAKVAKWLKHKRIDCLFIDGDKTKFLEDFYVYRSMMNKPSVVFMHDIQDREPKTAFETLLCRGYDNVDTIIDTRESYHAMALQDRGLPSSGCYEDWLRIWKGRSAGVGVIRLE